MTEIQEVRINVVQRTIQCYGPDAVFVEFPRGSKKITIKYAKTSAGGLIVQAIIRLLYNAHEGKYKQL